MARTALFSRKQPGGVYDYVSIGTHPADVWFVDSTNVLYGRNAVGYGHNPDKPFLTLDYAVGQCTANAGDVIYCLPGHAETVTAAGGLDLDVAGITIIGLGTGTLIPTVTLTTANTADVDVDAHNITVRNIRFVANFLDIVAAIDVNMCNAAFIDCRFMDTDTDLNARIWIQDANNVDYLTVRDCLFYAPDADNTHGINLSGDGFGHVIEGNRMYGDWGVAAIGGAGVVVFPTIANNYIWNIAAVNDTCIVTAAAGGMIVGNMVATPQAQANSITAVDSACFENFGAVAAEDLSGAIEPLYT